MPAETAHFSQRVISATMVAVLLSGCGRQPDGAAGSGSDEEPRLAVRTVAAEERTIEETVDAIGRGEALPNYLVTLTPAVAGHVHKILVNLGDFVHRGDPIIQLDTVITQADVAEKEAQRDTLKAALDLLVIKPREEDRRALEISVDQAKVAVVRAEAACERLRTLRARMEVSEAQWFEAEQAAVQARLQQQSCEAQLQLLLVGPRPEAIGEAKARLAAAEQTLAVARAHLELHTLRSPIDGFVDSLACHPGQAIAAATTVAEIVDSRQLHVTAWLPSRAADKVEVGQTARIRLEDAPRDASRKNQAERGEEAVAAEHQSTAAGQNPLTIGKVVSLGRIIDPQTGNLPARLLIDNPTGRIAVGQTVFVSIVVAETAKVLTVPQSALVDLGEGPLLIVVRDGKTVELHPESVAAHGQWAVVHGTDLRSGEPVVIEGGFNLPKGTDVRIETGKLENAEHAPTAEARP